MNPSEKAVAEARGFMKSRVILSAAALDIFTRLDGAPQTAAELAEKHGLDARGAARLCDCLAALGLLEKQGDLLRLSPAGACYSALHPESVLPMLLHLNRLWNSWDGLTEAVRSGKTPASGPKADHDEASRKAFIGAMHAIGRELSEAVARDFNLAPFTKLLDIGGASGTYTMAFLRQNPAMTACIFDLPQVLPLAQENLAANGFLERVELAAGDFTKDPLPTGCDLALLSAIIHQNSPAQNLRLFSSIHAALPPGGVMLIRDHIMDASRTRPPAGAMFAINMLLNTPGGDCYTLQEVRQGLEQAGFVDVRQIRQGEAMDCLVEARKPG